MSAPLRLDPEREQTLRVSKTGRATLNDLKALLGEITYLRGEVERETAYASELRRRLDAGPVPVVQEVKP